MKTQIISHQQGSREWHSHRATHLNASDIAAVMGVSSYKTRSQILNEKATGLTPEIDAITQSRFDKGHKFEAIARPWAEDIIENELYPVVLAGEYEGLSLSASLDGLDIASEISFEHKTGRADLLTSLETGVIPDEYHPQIEQGMLLSGAKKCLFMASSGDKSFMAFAWYVPNLELRAKIIAAWKQFAADLAAYVPSDIVEMPKASVTLALPALFIHAKGEITTSNMPEYGKALAARLESVRSIALVTDQDFSDAKEAAKLLRENIESARQAKDAMLAQTVTVGEAARMIDAWCEDMRLTALQLEKDVAREDLAKKTAMIFTAITAYAKHLEALESEIAPHRVKVSAPVFADAIKGKRNFVSMQDGLNTMLANSKIAADGVATGIRRNLAHFSEHAKGHEALFADKEMLMRDSFDYVALSIASRISKHQAAELAKEEATRARIRVEEQAKAESESREKVQAAPALVPIAVPAIQTIAPSANVVPMRAAMPAAQTPPTLKLGQISERLGFNLTGEFLKNLGFEPAARDKNAVLFHEADFPFMCMRLVAHIQGVQARQAA